MGTKILCREHGGEGFMSDCAACQGQASSGNGELLCVGDIYNFKNQTERLKYIGKRGDWHRFEKIGEWGVWSEILDSDLHLIEKQ